MILKVLIIFDPKLNLFKSNAYIFMQQSLCNLEVILFKTVFLGFPLPVTLFAMFMIL